MALLLDVAVKVSLLMLATGAAIAIMRRASAASRHVALTAALGAAVLLPAAKFSLPALPLFVLAPESQPAPAPVPAPTAVVQPAPLVAPTAAATSGAFETMNLPVTDARVVRSTAGPEGPAYGVAAVPAWSLSRALALIWLAGAAAILLNMTIAIVRIKRLTREARPVDDDRMTERLADIKNHFGVRRPVALLISEREWMPITWGLVRPTILLPASATSWLNVRLDAVLVHEMAHICRGDALAQRVTRIAVALFWFNPLVWLAARRARFERERACDDAVLARGLRASDYANDLIELAQTLAVPSRASATALAMARRSQLEQRVSALLDNGISRRGTSGLGRFCAVALVVLMLPMAAAQLAARPLPPVVPAAADVEKTTDVAAPPQFEQLDAPKPAPVAVPAPVQTHQTRPLSEGLRALGDDLQAQQLLDQPSKWRLERDAMYRLLLNRAQALVKDVKTMAEIGTAAPIDAKPLQETLDLVERNATAVFNGVCMGPDPFAQLGGGTCVNGSWTRGASTNFIQVNSPSDEQIAGVKARFAQAIRNLDAAEVRWHNGLMTSYEIAGALRAALKVLTDVGPAPDSIFTAANFPNSTAADRSSAQALYELLTGRVDSVTAPAQPISLNTQGAHQDNVPIRFVTRSGTNTLSDAQLIDLLKDIALIKGDAERANALLDLGSRYAFTPEMVTLYVAAAKGISSPVEQARVFAQPIRVK